MNHLIKEKKVADLVACDSAGTASYHVGNPPDKRMSAAAQKQGITLVGSARQFTPADFERFDLILAMDESNYRDILSLDTQQQYADKVKLMCEFARQHNDTEVPDPYYGGEAGFDYVISLLTDACENLLAEVLADSV